MKKNIPFDSRGYYTRKEIATMLSRTKNGKIEDTSIRVLGDMISSLNLANFIIDLLSENGYRVTVGMHKVEKDPQNRVGDYVSNKIRIYINFKKKGGD